MDNTSQSSNPSVIRELVEAANEACAAMSDAINLELASAMTTATMFNVWATPSTDSRRKVLAVGLIVRRG